MCHVTLYTGFVLTRNYDINWTVIRTLNCRILGKRSVFVFSRLRGRDVRDSLLSRAPPYPPRVGHVILKTMCSSQFVCAKRLRKFGCFDRFTFVYLPSILDMRPEDAQKICKSSFVRTFVLFSFVIRFPLVQVASFAFCNFQLYRLRLRRLCRRACDRLNIFQCPKFVLWLYSTSVFIGLQLIPVSVGMK